MESFTRGLYRIGEVIIYAIVSFFYSGLILLPIFAVDLLVEGSISSYIIIFIPLIGLLGFALERQAVSFTAAFVNDKKVYLPYFKEVFNKDWLSKYGLYTLLFALYYYANGSLSIIGQTSAVFGILRIILMYFYRGIIFYTILQTSHRQYVGIIASIKNSLILTYKYFIFTILIFVVWEVFENLYIVNSVWMLIFIIIFAALINTINEYAIKKI